MPEIAHPLVLLLLLAVAPLAWILWRRAGSDPRRRQKFASPRLLRRAGIGGDEALVLLRGGAVLVAFALAVVALAGPGLGHVEARKGTDPGDRLAVVLDVSRSMHAEDGGPGGTTRIAAAERLADHVLGELSGTRVCVVFFAGKPRLACPLTTDARAASILLSRPPDDLPGGTDVAAALKAASHALGPSGRILLLTDGEELSGHGAAAADAAHPVTAVGFGTLRGAPIPEGRDGWGNPRYHQFHGEPVVTVAHPETLSAIARASGGTALDGAVPGLAEQLVVRFAGATRGNRPDGVRREDFQAPLLVALLLLIAEAASGWRWPRQAGRPAGTDDGRRRSRWVWLAVLGLTQVAWTWPWDVVGENDAGLQALQHRHFPEAADHFRRAGRGTSDFRPAYNLGEALYLAGRYAEAEGAFREALRLAGGDRQAQELVCYDLGNVLYREAQAAGDRGKFAAAADQYRGALAIAPKDADARHNLALAERRQHEPARPQPAPSPSAGPGAGGAGTPLPSEAEVDSVLAALQDDERQRTAAPPTGARATPEQSAARILDQLLHGGARPSEDPATPDW